jgi:NADPH-dependent glutamate synthase beta subunit-like oxidoreductase
MKLPGTCPRTQEKSSALAIRGPWPALAEGAPPAGYDLVVDATADSAASSVIEALHAFGVLRYGIPQYRLPKEIVRISEHLKALGAEFVRDVTIGNTVTIDQLVGEMGYSAVLSAPARARRSS